MQANNNNNNNNKILNLGSWKRNYGRNLRSAGEWGHDGQV